MVMQIEDFVKVGSYLDLKAKGSITAQANGHTVVLFAYGDKVYAVDNRCPHMGFPLNKGTVKDGILTCYWHYARFDLASGGTFDQWADDVQSFPVQVRGDDVFINVAPRGDAMDYHHSRLSDGLERNISLVIAKAVINMLANGEEASEPFRVGLDFGVRYRQGGWGRGLTTHTCMMNLIAFIDPEDRPRALYHGLSDVANDTEGMAPRFCVKPLPNKNTDIPTLKRWFRQFVDVRDTEGAERCIISAIRAGATQSELADILFAAATDHHYLDSGHTLDFINKGLEALDTVGWEQHAEWVLSSAIPNLTNAMRMEESNSWRYPIDLVTILAQAYDSLPHILDEGQSKAQAIPDFDTLVPVILGDDPQASVDMLTAALRKGVTPQDLAGVVAYAAAVRIAQFHTSNEFNDWDTALHTFTYSNAVHQGLRRTNSADLVRGIFDAAMSVYMDRFLNIPAVRLPRPSAKSETPAILLEKLEEMLNHQQQVNQVGELVAQYLYSDGDPAQLMAAVGRLLLREDRNFHTIQCIEAAFQQYTLLKGESRANHVLVAAARYLAAHAPTMRSQGQTYQIANRLSRGEHLFEGE